MKEEHNKQKSVNDKLQSDLDALRGVSGSEAGSRTRGATGRNTPLSEDGHEGTRNQLADSQRQLQRLNADRQELKRQLDVMSRELDQAREDILASQNESDGRLLHIDDLEADVERLSAALAIARNGQDETLLEQMSKQNAALTRENQELSSQVQLLLDDMDHTGFGRRPLSGVSGRDSESSTGNTMNPFESLSNELDDWQRRVVSPPAPHPVNEYDPHGSRLGTR